MLPPPVMIYLRISAGRHARDTKPVATIDLMINRVSFEMARRFGRALLRQNGWHQQDELLAQEHHTPVTLGADSHLHALYCTAERDDAAFRVSVHRERVAA